MGKLPKQIKLTRHAQMRLEERKDSNIYNTKNLMRSSCRWYNKDDMIPDTSFYLHCLYVCRKSKQIGYITDGKIEVIYNKGTGVAITVMEVKEKFQPVTQYIKPEILKQIERKKEIKKMGRTKLKTIIGICPDCEKENVELFISENTMICKTCKVRKDNAKRRGKEYIAYKNLSKEGKAKIDRMQAAQSIRNAINNKANVKQEIPMPEIPVIENYYQVKAEQNPDIIETKIPVTYNAVCNDNNFNIFNPLSDQTSFILTLRECGCEIPTENLAKVLDVLVATDKLKDIFMTIVDDTNQKTMLDLEQMLNVVERKLQHNWEYNGFQEVDDIKFKGFLTWRRVLKGAIFFWKKLYQTNTLIEMQKAWRAYTADPNEKQLLSGDKVISPQKRFQITTESISTIFNTRRPFTRVFYAVSKKEAYEKFIKWMSDRQLHEDKSKTTIVELTTEGE